MSAENENDMSMEEILASIRKIIATDDENDTEDAQTSESENKDKATEVKKAPSSSEEEPSPMSTDDGTDTHGDDDVLDLTQEVQKDGSVVDLSKQDKTSNDTQDNQEEKSSASIPEEVIESADLSTEKADNNKDAQAESDDQKEEVEENTDTLHHTAPEDTAEISSIDEGDTSPKEEAKLSHKEEVELSQKENAHTSNTKKNDENILPETRSKEISDDSPEDLDTVKDMDLKEEVEDVIPEALQDLTDMIKAEEEIEAAVDETIKNEKENIYLDQESKSIEKEAAENSQNSHHLTSDNAPEKVMGDGGSSIISDTVAHALSSSLSDLHTLGTKNKEAKEPIVDKQPGGSSVTLEDMIVSSVRPMLKQWIDTHLPQMMHDIIQEEIRAIIEKKFR